jgi:hypothetical protein
MRDRKVLSNLLKCNELTVEQAQLEVLFDIRDFLSPFTTGEEVFKGVVKEVEGKSPTLTDCNNVGVNSETISDEKKILTRSQKRKVN